ncbi:19893_t:CDS:2 [Funneliformis geosporum]|nr:19893_t:CDS:2 [Funneliformis geosporum]
MSDDPFFTVKEEIEQNFTTVTTLFESWNRIFSTVSSRKNEELRRTEEELKSTLQDIATDLDAEIRRSLENNRHQELIDGHKSTKLFEQVRSKSRYEEVIEMDNTKFIENESLQQTILLREQDDQLESLYGTARNIHEIATTMGTELEDQNILLDEFGDQVDRTQGRLDKAMRKVAYIIKHNEVSRR